MLGQVSDQERREVQCLSHIYPEIKEELNQLEIAFEKNAEGLAKQPPTALKSVILSAAIEARKKEEAAVLTVSKKDEAKVVHMTSSFARTMRVAASVAIFAAAAWYIVTLRNQISAEKESVAQLLEKKAKDSVSLSGRYSELYGVTSEILKGASRKIEINPTENYPNAAAMTVIWNDSTGKVTCIANGINLASADLDYQLWAIVDGKPASLGVMGKDDNGKPVIAMQSVKGKVQAFAITLEKKGGVNSPTLERMILFGKV